LGRSFFIMKPFSIILYIVLALSALFLAGCASTSDGYHEKKEYSDMPWNTQQSWEGSRQIPGMMR